MLKKNADGTSSSEPSTNSLSENIILIQQFDFTFFKKLIQNFMNKKHNHLRSNHISDEINNENYVATHDTLTMLPNRSFLLYKIKQAITDDTLKSRLMALFFLDIDGFKDINDKAGYKTGDLILKEVSKRLIDNTRMSDVISRHGSDEFIVFLPEIRSLKDSEIICNKILDILAEPIYINNEVWNISATIGVALYPDDGITSEQLIHNADAAMYMAKQEGKSKIKYFNKDIDEELDKKYNIINEIREAIIKNQFDVVLQPQHNLQTNEISGVELFIRWIHPKKGIILPNDFLPYIYHTGYINSLGDLIVRKALGLYYELNRTSHKKLTIALKVTPRQFINDTFIERIAGLRTFGVNTNCLMIEITENCFKNNFEIAREKLIKLKNTGVKICLDNFGLGNSSLSQLFQLPIDFVKIDNNLLYVTQNNEQIKKGLIALVHNLNIKVIIKKIEDPEKLARVQELDCDYAQGYCYSKPLQLTEFIDYVQKVSNYS